MGPLRDAVTHGPLIARLGSRMAAASTILLFEVRLRRAVTKARSALATHRVDEGFKRFGVVTSRVPGVELVVFEVARPLSLMARALEKLYL